jgi:hypothetical protein
MPCGECGVSWLATGKSDRDNFLQSHAAQMTKQQQRFFTGNYDPAAILSRTRTD